MYYIGLMSGTSMDAIDAAIVSFESGQANLEFYREYPIDNSLRHQIRSVNENTDISNVSELDNELGYLFARAVIDILKESDINSTDVIAIGSHGQTVLHRPLGSHTSSIQIGDPNIICYQTGLTTVADFRRMDMACGGQGAPLASAFHQYQFHKTNEEKIILNIGGMANITILSDDKVIGFDTGPGNALLDDWTQLKRNQEFDQNGNWANQGNVNEELLELMLKDEYFSLKPPKSTGREYFNVDWIKKFLDQVKTIIPDEDVQATLLQLSSMSIVQSIKLCSNEVTEVLACGGGAHNTNLMHHLRKSLDPIQLSTTDKYGLNPDCIEAVTFAWLAKQRIEEKSANLPDVTGANKNVVLGAIYSAAHKNS